MPLLLRNTLLLWSPCMLVYAFVRRLEELLLYRSVNGYWGALPVANPLRNKGLSHLAPLTLLSSSPSRLWADWTTPA